MARSKCLGCGKSLGGLLDGYGIKVMSGQVCLSCKNKLEPIPNYQFLSPPQIKDFLVGRLTTEEAAAAIQQKFANMSPSAAPASNQPALSAAEEIRQFKELYDEGIITKEEFDQAKSRILNR